MDKKKLSRSLLQRTEEAELFTKRFVSFNKSDYEVLMFTIFLDCNEKMDDYDISIALGIPETKVRNLRVKSQLQYPREINMIEQIASSIRNGFYDNGMVTITIEDPNVKSYIKHIIESNDGIANITLNSKQLVLPLISYITLATEVEKDKDKIIKVINEKINETRKIQEITQKRKFGKELFSNINDASTFLESIENLYTKGKPVVIALIALLSKIKI